MSIPKMISGLQKSTKMTIIACAAFLALTALVLLFLMLFPIEPEEKPTLQVNQPQQTAALTELPQETAPPEEGRQTEAPHTLSTWSASIEGHSRSTNEYFEYIRSTYEPQETMWHQYITEPSEEMTEWTETEETDESATGSWEETTTAVTDETEMTDTGSGIELPGSDETVTETVDIPPVSSEERPTDPPLIDAPETGNVVITLPPELLPTDPPVADVPAVPEEGENAE